MGIPNDLDLKNKYKLHFETKSHLIYGHKVNYFSEEELKPIFKKTEDVIHELNKLMRSLN